MSDLLDAANETETLWTETAIRQAHYEANTPAKHYSSCQYCGDPTENGDRFCCTGPNSCATDFNRQAEILKRQGL